LTLRPVAARQPPTLWIIGGANGSGKSTAYTRLAIEETSGSVWIINPDLLTARIRDQESLDQAAANLASVQRIEKWLYASVATHQTVGVETVLSTDKYRKLVRAAKKRGFRFKLIYLVLASAALNVERVRARVAMGGHDVPEAKIIARRASSLSQLPWFMAHADYALVLDNSGSTPIEVAIWRPGELEIRDSAIPEVKSAIDAAIELFRKRRS
jgi:predicted ABC-type ATPase